MTKRFIRNVPTTHGSPETHRKIFADAINQLISATIPNTAVDKVTSNTTLTKAHGTVYCDTDSAAITITLPPGADWLKYRIINTGSSGNNVTITPNGAELLLGVNSNFTLLDGDVLIIEYEANEGWW